MNKEHTDEIHTQKNTKHKKQTDTKMFTKENLFLLGKIAFAFINTLAGVKKEAQRKLQIKAKILLIITLIALIALCVAVWDLAITKKQLQIQKGTQWVALPTQTRNEITVSVLALFPDLIRNSILDSTHTWIQINTFVQHTYHLALPLPVYLPFISTHQSIAGPLSQKILEEQNTIEHYLRNTSTKMLAKWWPRDMVSADPEARIRNWQNRVLSAISSVYDVQTAQNFKNAFLTKQSSN